MIGTSALSPDQVRQIVSLDDDPVTRNLLITLGYHRLSHGMAELHGGDQINWCTMGTWASRTAGRFIRKEEVSTALQKRMADVLGSRNTKHVLGEIALLHPAATADRAMAGLAATTERVLDDVGDAIMQGNRVVFEELALAFARFLEAYGDGGGPRPERLAEILSQYEPGVTRPDAIVRGPDGRIAETRKQGGQTLLRDMLTHYHEAMFEPDPIRKAQLILLANAEGGLHEQTRLQTYIAASLNAPIDDLLRMHWDDAVTADIPPEATHGIRSVLGRLIHAVADEVHEVWHAFTTIEMMTLKLPDGVLRLGRDLPAPPGGPLFPAALETISLDELRGLLEQYDAHESTAGRWNRVHHTVDEARNWMAERLGVPPDVIGTRAFDWSRLSQRMRYILELFRSRQADANLFQPPFTPEQEKAILSGAMPQGSLY